VKPPALHTEPVDFGDERGKLFERTLARHHYSGSALIEVLHRAQELYGYLSLPLLATIAHKLKLPPSRVLGVATFYHLFRFEPPRKHSAIACMGTACYAAGARELMSELQRYCAVHSGDWTLTQGRCVGSCGLAPVVICDGDAWPHLTLATLKERLEQTGGR
jgi:bidirectional [NiFe] hydrogenase diaphorase subunit